MAVSHAERLRCPGCGVFLPGAPDPDDYGDDERAYHHDVDDRWKLHDCPALEAYGPRRVEGEQRARGGRPSSGRAKRAVRNYRYRCACESGPPIRCGRRDLDATCGRCGCRFTWDPSGSEQLAPIRQPA